VQDQKENWMIKIPALMCGLLSCSYCVKYNHNSNHRESKCFWQHPHLKPNYNDKPLSIEQKHTMYQLSVKDEAKCTTVTVANMKNNVKYSFVFLSNQSIQYFLDRIRKKC
jgi:hypothetical protein